MSADHLPVWRALTLYQPWATAVAHREKRMETRSWSTKYRGPLMIHAGLGAPAAALQVLELVHKSHPHALVGPFPRGEIVAVANLVDVVGAWSVAFRPDNRPPDLEFMLGDFSNGRFAWVLDDVVALDRPVPAKGHQGLWTPSAELVAEVTSRLPSLDRPRSRPSSGPA